VRGRIRIKGEKRKRRVPEGGGEGRGPFRNRHVRVQGKTRGSSVKKGRFEACAEKKGVATVWESGEIPEEK